MEKSLVKWAPVLHRFEIWQNGTRNTLQESDQPPARKRIIWHFWSQNLKVDLRRIYLTPRDLTVWSQQYRDDKCKKQL